MEPSQHALTREETERCVDEIQPVPLDQYGSDLWFQQHILAERLNNRAHYSVQHQVEEFVGDLLAERGKLAVLAANLIRIGAWKAHVWPKLDPAVLQQAHIKAYFLLFHEATLMNLLEIVLFHQPHVLALGPVLPDLIDYCATRVAWLNTAEATAARAPQEVPPAASPAQLAAPSDPAADLQAHRTQLQFTIAMTSISVLRYITECGEALPLGAQQRLFGHHDVPAAAIYLIHNAPWIRRRVSTDAKAASPAPGRREATLERFNEGRWEALAHDDVPRLGKTEAQVWLLLYNLLLEPAFQTRYPFTAFRVRHVMSLSDVFTATLRDQLPVIERLERYVAQVAILHATRSEQAGAGEEAAENAARAMAQVVELSDLAVQIDSADWNAVAQRATFYLRTSTSTAAAADATRAQSGAAAGSSSEASLLAQLGRLYNMDALEPYLGEPKCERCGAVATQRCSRCRNAWYCGRACQVGVWKAHKPMCDVLATSVQRENVATNGDTARAAQV